MGLLSWFGGDRRHGAPQDGAAPAGDGAGAESSAPGAATRPPTGAWRELPPVQRTTRDMDLLADPGGFRASLDSWQDVSLSGPVGHLIDPEAPAGLLYGVAAPVEPPAAATRGAARSSVPEPSSATGPAAPPGAGTTRPAVALQRILDGGPLTTATGTGSGPARHITGEPVAPDAAPVVHDLLSPPTAPPTPVQRALEPTSSPHPHHLGVGEPLTGLPPTAQREPAARSAPAPSRPDAAAPPGLPLPAAAGSSETVREGPVPPSGPLLADDPLVPVLDTPVQRQATPQPEHGRPQTPPPEAPTGSGSLTVVGLQRLPDAGPQAPSGGAGSPAGPERVAGLTGERPLPLYSGADPAPRRDPGPPVVLARWPVAAGPEAAGRSTPSDAGTARTLPSVQAVRSAAETDPAPVPPGPGPRPLGAPDAGKPSSARAGLTGLWADAGSAAVASGVAQRAADGSVVFGALYPVSPAGPPPAVQRAAESVPEAVPEPMPAPPTEPAAEPGPVPATPATSGGPGGGPHPGGPDGAQERDGARQVDDELVRALFPRLSRLIKAELRLDRERAGFLINTRH